MGMQETTSQEASDNRIYARPQFLLICLPEWQKWGLPIRASNFLDAANVYRTKYSLRASTYNSCIINLNSNDL